MDEIVRLLSAGGTVKAVAITGKEMVERARTIHHLTPLATAALGRALMGASMLGNALKGEGASITLRIKGGGPLGAITAVSDAQGNVRGYLQDGSVDLPRTPAGKLDVGGGVGREGTITVIKDLNLKEPYVGTIPLVSGEIAEDITAYCAESEQIPTVCALGVLVERDYTVALAGGYLIQLLPGATEEDIAKIEAGVARVGAVTPAMEQCGTAENVVCDVLSAFQMTVVERTPVEYRCYCSQERVSRALISMGRDELEEIIALDEGAHLTCQFCDAVYHFDTQALTRLLAEASQDR